MRKILIFLLLFSLFTLTASAFEDTVERYETDYTDYWTVYASGGGYSHSGTLTVVQYPSGLPNSCILMYAYAMSHNSATAYRYEGITSNEANIEQDYLAFTVVSASAKMYIQYLDSSGTSMFSTTLTSVSAGKYEIIKASSSTFNIYKDGTLVASLTNSLPSYTGDVKVRIAAYVSIKATYSGDTSGTLYIDDITTSSTIGLQETLSEASDNVTFTWSGQLMRSYPDSSYYITLYSLTNTENSGETETWNIPDDDNSTGSEYGYFDLSRSSVLQNYYGLYLLEMTRGSIVLTDTYFYYYSISDPQDFPEILFLAESDVNTEIRDDSNNGGTISGGDSVYLYPDAQDENGTGVYNITFDILETPYSIEAELTKIYNTTTINGTNLLFSGLSSQNYYVSVDSTAINGTNGADTWNYTVTWDTLDSHIVSFEPDLTLPGIYGYVKNSETQNAIKSATITISNNTYTAHLYTDENGMYYLTKGMYPGTYNVSAAKSGYDTSVTYQITAQNNSTSRQDIYLDEADGAGVYYESHDVTFTVLEYWYSSAGLPGVTYSVYDNTEDEETKNGTTGSKGTFTVTDMDAGTSYTITLIYNGTTYTEYLEPGLTEYTFVLNKEGIVHQYYNSWLTLTYAQTANNATVQYTSTKAITEASFTVTANNGTIIQSNTLTTTSGTFLFNFTTGDYTLQFNIEASDGSTASQAWTISSPPEVTLFPSSYPAWLKNTLFVAIIIIFLLAFGKSKNDIACGSVAVLTSLGYYFDWLTCSFNFVVLIWLIALGAIFLHYKRTGAVG